MGELILIQGPNDSGKSAYAESLLARRGAGGCYVATMIPQTEENRLRIQRHRRQRAGLGLETLELPYQVGEAPVGPEAAVLLEDVSNLLANVFFENGLGPEAVLEDLARLQGRCALLVAVTISGLDPTPYPGQTAAYIRSLNWLNQALADRAAAVVQMDRHRPNIGKGGDLLAP